MREKLREQHIMEEQQIVQQLKWYEQGLCLYCGGRLVNQGFLGLFGKKCESCGQEI
jgi:uncharacterized protein (DUF983 family)